MQIFEKIADIRAFIKANANQSVGFVPTMGALHEGHISLIRQSVAENDITVCSIFVNPIQFNNPDDFQKYPKSVQQDIEMLKEAQCTALFLPSDQEMYPSPTKTQMLFRGLDSIMEGEFRHGHFSGVGVVVSKLFNIVCPQKAYFGQKDLQQYLIIKQMAKDLSFATEVVRHDTIRETDGLAMSSRNRRLSAEERTIAPLLFKALQETEKALRAGLPMSEIRSYIVDVLGSPFKLDYLEAIDVERFEKIENAQETQEIAVCIAAFLGDVRLIDNHIFRA